MDNKNTGRREKQQDLALLLAVFCGDREGGTGGSKRGGREKMGVRGKDIWWEY